MVSGLSRAAGPTHRRASDGAKANHGVKVPRTAESTSALRAEAEPPAPTREARRQDARSAATPQTKRSVVEAAAIKLVR